ncbi:histidine phosphatase family protein [uncultured Chitinophaga sp.]|uniref:histidine phosphatase family protein n=1 Tax=uncultured Chitinophaga sp. TaxID=339340 RepID=UPI0025EE3D40|nr:histidine phosphatase family protein [uncultured Chitinophaga sp.]
MEKEIYIIRHGETDFNRLGVVQGRGVNSDLNPLGQAQGEAFYNHYKHIQFDKVYTSALKRTYQTVQRFIEDNLPWQQLPGLDELSFGIWEGHASVPEWKEAFRCMDEGWKNGNCDLAFENGESPNQVAARLQEALDVILSNKDEKRVLVCMHGRALLVFLCLLTKTPLSSMMNFTHKNTGLYRVSYNAGEFEILDVNDVKHLDVLTVNLI